MEDLLSRSIIAAAYKVHNTLGGGFLEKVYENAMAIELERQGIAVVQQHPIAVYYEGKQVGQYFADLWIDNRVIVELKAMEHLAREHEVQLVHYLAATGIEIGLLINFGSSVDVKRKFRTYRSLS
jgi:GxxExxY protein